MNGSSQPMTLKQLYDECARLIFAERKPLDSVIIVQLSDGHNDEWSTEVTTKFVDADANCKMNRLILSGNVEIL